MRKPLILEHAGCYMPDVTIIEFDPDWNVEFAKETQLISRVLDISPESIEHVGSTSVTDLSAKPIIDILVARSGLDREYVITSLLGLGYSFWDKDEFQQVRLMFYKNSCQPVFNVHVADIKGEFWSDLTAFRNRLRSNPDLARSYESLKRRLAYEHQNDLEAYTAAKTAFVRQVTGARG